MEMIGHSGISVSFLETLGIEPALLATGAVTDVLRGLSNKKADEWCATPSIGGKG